MDIRSRHVVQSYGNKRSNDGVQSLGCASKSSNSCASDPGANLNPYISSAPRISTKAPSSCASVGEPCSSACAGSNSSAGTPWTLAASITAKSIKRRRISRSVGQTVFRLPKGGPHFFGKVRGYCALRGDSSGGMQDRPFPTEKRDITQQTTLMGSGSAALQFQCSADEPRKDAQDFEHLGVFKLPGQHVQRAQGAKKSAVGEHDGQ